MTDSSQGIFQFFDQYDLHNNPYKLALDIIIKQTSSTNGIVLAIKNTELLIVSDEVEDYLIGYQGTLIDKSIKTKLPSIGSKKMVLPYFGEVNSIFVIPIINKDKIVVGLICLIGGVYDLGMIQTIKHLLLLIRIHLDKAKIVTEPLITTKDLFLANMSHEIQTPLNGIIGYLQLLMQTPMTEKQRQYITSVNKCSLNLVQIINDILDFSKLLSGKMKVISNICKIGDIVEFVRETLNPKILERQHIFLVKLSFDLPEFITLDKGKVIQVLMNLVSNAIKFTQRGGTITISVSIKPDSTLYFNVKDTGTGISREDQNKLFRTFTQLDNNIDKSYTGSGLGLAISKKLVNLMGGTISLRSELGQGSEFFFTVKYEGYQSSLLKVLKSGLFKGRSILIAFETVEDRLKYSDLLLGWGMKPSLCGSSAEGKKLLGSFSYDFELCVIGLNDGLIDMVKETYPLMPVIDIGQNNNKSDYHLQLNTNKIDLFNTLDRAFSESQYIKKKDSLKINTSLNILIAEDIPSNQDLLVTMLSSLGYTKIKVVNDGIETIQAVKEGNYDLLLLDLKMPRMDGYKVLEQLKGSKIKIIPVTASVLDEDRLRCENLGINEFLKKPISMKELQMALLL